MRDRGGWRLRERLRERGGGCRLREREVERENVHNKFRKNAVLV